MLSRRLLDRFGTTGDVINASPQALRRLLPGDEAAIEQIKVIRNTLEQVLRNRVLGRTILSDEPTLIDYLRFQTMFADTERFRVVYLDVRNCLICDEIVASGCVRGVAVHPRQIMRRAIEVGATALILVHNHPSGDPTPSKADVRVTGEIVRAARALSIQVHDHLIVASSGHVSLRNLGHL